MNTHTQNLFELDDLDLDDVEKRIKQKQDQIKPTQDEQVEECESCKL